MPFDPGRRPSGEMPYLMDNDHTFPVTGIPAGRFRPR
jgi:hypothetical protein